MRHNLATRLGSARHLPRGPAAPPGPAELATRRRLAMRRMAERRQRRRLSQARLKALNGILRALGSILLFIACLPILPLLILVVTIFIAFELGALLEKLLTYAGRLLRASLLALTPPRSRRRLARRLRNDAAMLGLRLNTFWKRFSGFLIFGLAVGTFWVIYGSIFAWINKLAQALEKRWNGTN